LLLGSTSPNKNTTDFLGGDDEKGGKNPPKTHDAPGGGLDGYQ